MTGQIAARVRLAMAGGLGGALLWTVFRAGERGWIGHYPAFALFGLILVGFGALLAMAGPTGLGRAVPRAFGLGAVVAGLIGLTALRWAEAEDLFDSPIPAFALMVAAALPVPFLIAAARTSWRDYPALFLEAWSIVLRGAAAAAFTGLVWLVIYLSDEVLRIVGIDVIQRLLRHEVVPMVLTGAVFGLGMAVIYDLAELLSPYVVLRVFRLFLPVVLAVMGVFLVALPFRGLDGLAGDLSPAALLLTMVAGGVALVSIAIDQTDAEATRSPLLIRCAQGMALVLPLVAALALYAIWLRVADYGWTPERLFILLVAGVGLAYGLVYALAVLRGPGWMERVRQGNIRMALVIIALAVLWLTPVLNAERISAQSQLARFEAGKTDVAELDLPALRSWGKPGAEVIARLEETARAPGQEALAAALAGQTGGPVVDREALVAALAIAMPVQPATATETRDRLLRAVDDYQLQDWTQVCTGGSEAGAPHCLMVVADLLPNQPGEEAILFLQRSPDYTEISGLYLDEAGNPVQRSASHPDGRYPDAAEATALLRQYHQTVPPVTAVPLNQLGTGPSGLIFLP
ncbi:DUF4153 domain-containing protein [Tabrizicola sp.]|uniref:DUF4153 domain-containing protein n=1 Tax=Tabrizicola sp. TaxID=2005166 RepID=UPI001A4FD428|nr:DUF4153 domain-containing protein [Tabrizicola sp.]MBL9073065.1 DUF4153 domain-containing protein [Tabrizicola sp.]